jgi:hypothetical protein
MRQANWILTLGSLLCAASLSAQQGGEAVAVAKTKGSAEARPITVAVDIMKDVRIIGTLTEANQLLLKSSFGEVTVPFTEIAGIRFATKDDTVTTVVMLNGDSITGATDLRSVTVETEWGTAKINGATILSIMFVPELAWTSTAGLNGKRWNLVDSKSPAPRPTTAGTNSPAVPGSGNRSIPGGQPQPSQLINN